MEAARLLVAATLVVQVPADPDGPLEPSVLNEVEHAVAVARTCPTNAPPSPVGDVFGTNGLSRAGIAIMLVSRQDRDGCWFVNGTNVTAEAVAILSAVKGGSGQR